MPILALDRMIQRQKLIWHAVAEKLNAYNQEAGIGPTPLKRELQLCTKLVMLFLESSEQNLNVAKRAKNPRYISTFSLLKSIVLSSDLFKKSFASVYRVSVRIALETKHDEDLNQFECTVVTLVGAVAELAKEVRGFKSGLNTSVSEAYELASANVKLGYLFE